MNTEWVMYDYVSEKWTYVCGEFKFIWTWADKSIAVYDHKAEEWTDRPTSLITVIDGEGNNTLDGTALFVTLRERCRQWLLNGE